MPPEFNQFEYARLGFYQLVLNNSRPPFNSEKVRKAIELGLDFDALAKGVGWKPEYLQAGFFPYGMRGFRQRAQGRNVAEANKLLASAGYSAANPLKFTITMAKAKTSEHEATIWPHVFEGAWIKPVVELVDQNVLVDRRNAATFDALRIYKVPGSVDGDRLLSSYLTNSQYNTPRSVTRDCDKLIKAALQVVDVDERYHEYEKADACLMGHTILIPLASFQPGLALVRKPWALMRKNRYNLRPYDVQMWSSDAH